MELVENGTIIGQLSIVDGRTAVIVDKPWSYEHAALYIRPLTPEHQVCMDALYAYRNQRREVERTSEVRAIMGWVWQTPEPLRDGILALVADVERAWANQVGHAPWNLMYSWLADALGLTTGDEPYAEEDMLRVLREPISRADALLMMQSALKCDDDDYLNDRDWEVLKRAASDAA